MESRVVKLRILTVSLKLKFRCKMRIQSEEGISTQEILPNNNLFQFDEEMQIKLKNNNMELSIILFSEKGSQYNGGIVKMGWEELKEAKGTSLRLAINRCIDRQAWIQFRVVQFKQQQKQRKDMSFTQQRQNILMDSTFTPERNKKGNLVIQSNLGQTRSQHCFPLPTTSFRNQEDRNRHHQTARPHFGEYSNIRMNKNKDHKAISPFNMSPQRDSPRQDQMSRIRLQADHSASKVKKMQDKIKKQQDRAREQLERRKKIESSQQNCKLQLVRLSICKEENDKEIQRKDMKIKQLNSQIIKFRQFQKKYHEAKLEIKTKTTQLQSLQNQIASCKRELNEISNNRQLQLNKIDVQSSKQKKQLQRVTKDKDQIIQQLMKKIKTKDEQISSNLQKMHKLQQQNQRQKRGKFTLDSRINQSKGESQRLINTMKKQLKQIKQQSSEKILKLQKQKSQLMIDLQQRKEQSQKSRINYSNALIEKRSLQQKIQQYQQNSIQIKKIKDRIQQQNSKYKIAKQQSLKYKKKYESALESNHKYQERLKNSYQDIQQINHRLIKNQEKIKESEEKNRRIEEEFSESKIQLERYKKAEQLLQRQLNSLKDKQKQTKAQLSRKQLQFTKLTFQLQNLREKATQIRQTNRPDYSRKMATSYYQDELEQSKINTLIEAQKFLQGQIINYKHNVTQLQMQLSHSREESQKWNRLESQWRQNQRNWESQKSRLLSQNQKLVRENKDMIKKMGEQDAKALILNEKLQKQRKINKLIQQKCNGVQVLLKKSTDQIQQLSSDLQVKQTRYRNIQTQLLHLKGEYQLRNNQRNKFSQLSESLDQQNRRLKQQLSTISYRYKQQQQHFMNENKKAREEMGRYEVRALNYKKQSEKFKDMLRNIIVESIVSHLPKEQQETEIIAKKRQNKLGLTLTNQLLIKLQDYLKQLHRYQTETMQKLRNTQKDLISSKQDGIMRTNQFQNTEAQLKMKLQDLIENLDKMKKIYEQRQQQMKKTIEEMQWQISLKQQQCEKLNNSLKQTKQKFQNQSISNSEVFCKKEQALNVEIQRMKGKYRQISERESSYADQIASLQQYIVALQANIAKYRSKQEQNQRQIEKFSLQIQQYKVKIQGDKEALQLSTKQKTELKNIISSNQSQIHQLKFQLNRFKGQLQQIEKQKTEGSSMVRNIMKQKQSLLHQYLASEQKVFAVETKLFEMEEKILQLTSLQQKNSKAIQQYKESKKKMLNDVKIMEGNLLKGQGMIKELEERLKEREKQVLKLQQTNAEYQSSYLQYKQKFEMSTRSWQSKGLQLHQELELKTRKLLELQQKYEQLHTIEGQQGKQLSKLKQRISLLTNELQQTNLKLLQSLQTNQKLQVSLFAVKSQLSQLRQQCPRLKGQLQQRDLKNYMLSSENYKLQSQKQQQIRQLQQKVIVQQESMLKYQEICEGLTAEIELLNRSKDTLAKQYEESQEELSKINLKYKRIGEQLDSSYETIKKMDHQLERMRQSRIKLQSSKSYQDRQLQEKVYQLQQKITKRQAQLQRVKNENQVLHQFIKNLQEKIRKNEKQLHQLTQLYQSSSQSTKRTQSQLKKLRQQTKQIHWSVQRQIKKLFQAKIRSLSQLQSTTPQSQNSSENIKLLQQSTLELIKVYRRD